MKFILGALIGGGIGYIMGTHAGREQYERIMEAVGDMVGQDVVAQVTDILDQGAAEMRKAASEAAESSSEVVEEAASGNGSGSD